MISSTNLLQTQFPIIGIKFGSFTTVLGTLNNLLLDIIFSETSARTIPSVVSYTDNFIKSGEAALISITKNISNSYRYINRLLCLYQESQSVIEHEKKFITANISRGNEAFLFNDTLPSELIVASFLHKLSKTWKNNTNMRNTNDIVISVPDFYTTYQRKALVSAIKIAGLNCISLLNESSAICLSYFFHHYRDITLTSIPQLVVFIDMGDTKTSVHVCSFTKNNPQIIFSISDKCLGCRDFDYAIYEEIINTHEKIKDIITPRMKIKIMEAISKNRKILTVNTEAVISFEIGDEEISYVLSRDKLKEIAKSQIDQFTQLITSSISQSQIDIDNIKSIEMVGDAIRNPIFHDIIHNEYKRSISKTLLADECIARGCALYNVMLHSHYATLNDFTLSQYNPFDIIISFSNTKLSTEFIALKKGESYPTKKAFRFKSEDVHDTRTKNVIVEISYRDKGNDFIVEKTKVYLPYLDDSTYTLLIEIVIDFNCVPKFISGFIMYDDKVPQRCVIENLYHFDSLVGIGKEDDLIMKEIEMEFNDYLSTCVINRKNEIESLLYHIRDTKENFNVDETITLISNETDINKLNEIYLKTIKENNIEKDLSCIDIENALRENINLILDNKERIAKESILKASKHIKTLIDEDVMKGDYDEKAKEEKIEMINLYRKEIIN